MSGSPWPSNFRINALLDDDTPADGRPEAGLKRRFLGNPALRPGHLLPTAVDPWNWQDPSVGWGLLLADDLSKDAESKAVGAGVAGPLLKLLEKRSGVLVYHDKATSGSTLSRYYEDGSAERLSFTAGAGTGRGCLPRFLLIAEPPAILSWSLQFELAAGFQVGRLALKGEALERYVTAACNDWQDFLANPLHSLVWAVDHGPEDITRLMRESIAEPLAQVLDADNDLSARLRFFGKAGAAALGSDLVTALSDTTPGLVVTTSHGATAPLSNLAKLAERIGVPVDAQFKRLSFTANGDDWMPAGAFWHCHACASAGTNEVSPFLDVVDPGSRNHDVLSGITQLGATVSPFATALLGGTRPLRAFIGHVEPTFDLSLMNEESGTTLTGAVTEAFYNELYRGRPIGWVFAELQRTRNLLAGAENRLRRNINRGKAVATDILAVQLAAADWSSMALLGDPAAKLPLG